MPASPAHSALMKAWRSRMGAPFQERRCPAAMKSNSTLPVSAAPTMFSAGTVTLTPKRDWRAEAMKAPSLVETA